MNKKTTTSKSTEPSPWDDEVQAVQAVEPEVNTPKKKESKIQDKEIEPLFDLEGLMTDFPTARELEKFVYDQRGIVLNLKGRSNKFKYQTALDVLNGADPDDYLLGTENPYLDKADFIPVDGTKQLPARDATIDLAGPEVHTFDTNLFPHPDPDLKAQGQNCQVRFVKYANGMITYEILGPVFQRAVGERINKYGKTIPERYVNIDPRTGEQVIVRGDGSLTPLGTRIRGFMRKQRFNKSNQWDVWIDRDFVVKDDFINDNPWAVQ